MTTRFDKLKFQNTINSPTKLSGPGLHTGNTCNLTIKPSEAGTGIIFKRVDLKNNPEVEALIDNVFDVTRSTSLKKGKVEIHTIEHILAALYGLGIDNALIELDSAEPPILDGSSKPYVDAIIKSGILEQDAYRSELVIEETITYSNQSSGVDIHVVPSDKFRITYMMDYRHKELGTQYTSYYSVKDEFINNVSPARTFVLISEVIELLDLGLIKGANFDNGILFLDKKLTKKEIKFVNDKLKLDDRINLENPEKYKNNLRFYNEPVRHKLLDLIGDLSLLGMPIRGHVIAARSGHAANIELVKKIRKKYMAKMVVDSTKKTNKKLHFNIQEILNLVPHRYPFLLIDRILELDPEKEVSAIKNVTSNEQFFQGHFPDYPIMPGVLLIEAMAQAGCFLILHSIPNPRTKLILISAIVSARFKKAVTPGDQLIIKAKLIKLKLGTCKISAVIYVNDEIVSESVFLASIVNRS